MWHFEESEKMKEGMLDRRSVNVQIIWDEWYKMRLSHKMINNSWDGKFKSY
jgi:hypothetical protein